MAKGHVRKRHTKLFKGLTIGGSIFGIFNALLFTVILILDMIGVNVFLTSEVRTYTATFMVEDSVYETTTYRRGDLLTHPQIPTKPFDGEKNYIFIGWDYTGEGLPDVLPINMYYSFTAKAVFLPFGQLNLSLEDLMNMDVNTLIQLLQDLNIDWEQFMNMFNLSLEDLMNLLQMNPVLTFYANRNSTVSYFRSTSYGDFNYSKKKFNVADKTLPNGIVSTLNPNQFTADRVSQIPTTALPDGFSYVNYEINYRTNKQPLPMPDCEMINPTHYGDTKTDAYVSRNVEQGETYFTEAIYAPAFRSVINLLKLGQFSSTAFAEDERNYRDYAHEHYTNVPNEYVSIVDDIINENGWYPNDSYYVDDIGKYVESQAEFCMLPDETGKIHKNSDPIIGMLESGKASDYDFNTLAVMIFRRLNIPARMVQGYLVPAVQVGYNTVTLLNQHYWCEIYIDGIGWMICDCTNGESLIGMNPYGGSYNNENNELVPTEEGGEESQPEYITGDLSGDVSTSGPGDKTDDINDVFTFTSQYQGTMYFRSYSYGEYDGEGHWSSEPDYVSFGANPLTFSYRVVNSLYKNTIVNINYLSKMNYGLSPVYSYPYSVLNYVDTADCYTTKNVKSGTTESYYATSIPLQHSILKKAVKKGKEIGYSQDYYDYAYNKYGPTKYNTAYNSYFNDIYSNYFDGQFEDDLALLIGIKDYFQNHYTYNISYEPYPEGVDPIISFLERGEGICNNFASATTMFYRFMGFPARFVTGYGANSQGNGKRNTVNTLDAHAWVEVYVKEIGWLTVDSTGFSDGHGDGSSYGSGFGGGGTDQFEGRGDKHIIEIDYTDCEAYGYSYISKSSFEKEYDNQPLPEGFVRLAYTYDELEEGHEFHVLGWDHELTGLEEPGQYAAKVLYEIVDEDGNDVSDEYEVKNTRFNLYINEIDMGDCNIQLQNSIQYTGTPFTFNDEYCLNNGIAFYWSFENQYKMDELGHYVVRFIPNPTTIESKGYVTIDGSFLIYDQEGKDVSYLYYFEDTEVEFYVS